MPWIESFWCVALCIVRVHVCWGDDRCKLLPPVISIMQLEKFPWNTPIKVNKHERHFYTRSPFFQLLAHLVIPRNPKGGVFCRLRCSWYRNVINREYPRVGPEHIPRPGPSPLGDGGKRQFGKEVTHCLSCLGVPFVSLPAFNFDCFMELNVWSFLLDS